MKALVALSAVVALAAAQNQPFYPYAGFYGSYAPYTYAATPYSPYAYAAPAVHSSQYHAQDEIGGYAYGYAGGPSSKHESKNAFGATVGSYQYIDANNEVQTVTYTSDPVHGFQVEATNLPVAPVADLKAPVAPVADLKAPVFNLKGPEPVQDTPEVAAAKAEFAAKYAAAAAAAEAAPDTEVETSERKRRSAVLIPTLRKATFKTASLDKVEADTPADTTLLELKEKEHETLVHAPAIAYAAPAVTYAAAPVLYKAPTLKKVEVKTLPAPITYATHGLHYAAPALTYTIPEVKVKEVEVKHVASPFAYSSLAYPYGIHAPLIYNIEAKAEEEEEAEVAVESAERKRRSAVLIPTLRKATFKTASLDKVEADTPADTTLLELKEKEHETLVHAPAIAYAAPAVTYAAAPVLYKAPALKKVEVKTLPAPITYATHGLHYAAPALTYTIPEVKVKEVEVKHVASPFAYSNLAYPYGIHAPLIYNIEPKAVEAEE